MKNDRAGFWAALERGKSPNPVPAPNSQHLPGQGAAHGQPGPESQIQPQVHVQLHGQGHGSTPGSAHAGTQGKEPWLDNPPPQPVVGDSTPEPVPSSATPFVAAPADTTLAAGPKDAGVRKPSGGPGLAAMARDVLKSKLQPLPSREELKSGFQRKRRRVQQRLRTFPWGNTWQVLAARFKEDRLGVTASSLTFTSLLALVPFFTVALALFTAFPIFGKAQLVLERWLMDSLIPETIARQVLGYLTQFASKASQLGLVGFSILIVTAVALILTIDRTLNNIWRVPQLRPLGQRVLIYWAAITLGPLVLGLSLVLSSYVMSASKGLVNTLPESVRFIFDSIEFVVLASGMAGLYHYVPNTPVRWRDAWVGGLFVAVFMEVAKKALGIYLSSVPTYSVIYGTFATLPILLIWMYVAWCIVLLGALVTAYLPTVLSGVERLTGHRGWEFELAVEVLQCLAKERELPHKGLYLRQLSKRLRIEASQILPVLQALAKLDWVGAVQPAHALASLESTEPRYVLLIDPQATRVEPLVEALLLQPSQAVEPLWQRAQLSELTVAQLIAAPLTNMHRV
ncbi:MAG: YihY family inner membrane protein [Comamonas sp.]